ncbi:suppressor of cytokine signaling 6 [Anthonomus grandis grandis]|uniref:suppressor of cytokine signaling 6 n=1 Tax=Anthonomus grandis grandis TaxID=2921223 RepID=UPI0021654942|nr:suppressor of cytokine signaling 6 [Anthonomus grandis grandis]
MTNPPNKRAKNWLKCLKMAKEGSQDAPQRDSALRRSFKGWHKRMKHLFSGSTVEDSPVVTPPAVTPPPIHGPKDDISELALNVWYWGPVSKALVEQRLKGAPDGAFLVRDSASERHVFSITFRSVGKTLHARIEHTQTGYKMFGHQGFKTVKDLIDDALRISLEKGLFCYTKGPDDSPNFPVRLLTPVSRYEEVRSLQHLARFIIRQHISISEVDKLHLPQSVISFLKEEDYF